VSILELKKISIFVGAGNDWCGDGTLYLEKTSMQALNSLSTDDQSSAMENVGDRQGSLTKRSKVRKEDIAHLIRSLQKLKERANRLREARSWTKGEDVLDVKRGTDGGEGTA